MTPVSKTQPMEHSHFLTTLLAIAIPPQESASEAIHSLKPVTVRYKKAIDPTRSLSFGLIAEEVARVSPDLVTQDREGKPETVRYEAVNAMLLNEFLKEHRKVEEQQAAIAELKSTVTQHQKEIETLAAGLNKVSRQIELSTNDRRRLVDAVGGLYQPPIHETVFHRNPTISPTNKRLTQAPLHCRRHRASSVK
jgi:uncharacterized coiled-coil protein SlyX